MKSEIRNPKSETNSNDKNLKFKTTLDTFKTFWSFEHLNFDIVSNFVLRASNLKQGFTLLELLVVVSIISILITLGLTSFSTVQKKARDSKRKSDIKEVQTALEQYYSVCGYQYPTPVGTFFSVINCPTPPISIMPTVPTDPRVITPYFCGPTPAASNCTSSSYTICAMLESETPNTFCVSNQQ